MSEPQRPDPGADPRASIPGVSGATRPPPPLTLRGVARLLGLGAATLGYASASRMHQALLPAPRRAAMFQRYLRRWANSLVYATGGRVSLVPGCTVPAQTCARLVVANHRSAFDIGILLGLFGGHAVSRADVADWPVFGPAATGAGTIYVDRHRADSGAAAIRTIRARLQRGASILVFPEGGTFGGDEVRPFKPGAFVAARQLDVEIVPVGLAYDPGVEWVNESFVSHVLRVTQQPETRCAVAVGAPQRQASNARETAARMHEAVQELVLRARQHWRDRFATP
jgi:1-acyl-sn-glycerol-3-phosphate acyltransferase